MRIHAVLALAGLFLFRPTLVTAVLQVTFQKVYDAPGATLGAPYCEGGPVYFSYSDGVNFGLATEAGLFVRWEDTIDGSQANQFYVGSLHNGVIGVGGYDNCCSGGPNIYQNALYLFSSGTGHRIADINTPVPGYSGQNKISGARPATDGTSMVFKLGTVTPVALARWQAGSISILATNGTPVPSSADTFLSFAHPFMSANGQFVFTAKGLSRSGVYLWNAGTLSKIVDSTDLKPGTSTAFGSGFVDDSAVRNGNDTAFSHTSAALYKIANGTLSLVANNTVVMPGLTNKFSAVSVASLQNGKVVFRGSSGVEAGIYTDYSGALEKIVDLRTVLDGRGISQLLISSGFAFAGNKAYFTVQFTNGAYAVYSATLASGPTGVTLVAQRNGANFTIQFPTTTGQTYDVQRAVTLSNSWQNVITGIVGTGATTNLNFPLSTNREFFRLQIHPP